MTTLHRAPYVLPIAAEPVRDGAVLVEGGRIRWVGPAAHAPRVPDVRDWAGVLTPGLVNAHTHLQYTAYADMYAPDADFFEWIAQYPVRNREMTDERWAAAARQGAAELLRTGTTCAADITAKRVVVEALAELGLAGVSYLELVGIDAATWPAAKARLEADLDAMSGSPRQAGISPHAPYTLATSVFRGMNELARQRGLRLHPHIGESAYEVEYVAAGTGPFAEANVRWGLDMELMRAPEGLSPVEYADAVGGLGPDVHVAHGVRTAEVDRNRLRARGTAVALCARSNATLGCGAPPVGAYRAQGNPVAVGTDSLASAPSLDLLAELPLLRSIALDQRSPSDGLDRWLVEAATTGGAQAMGLDDVGVLAPGARADLAVFAVPLDLDPYQALVRHGEGSCVGTVLAGEVVHEGASR